MRRWSLLLVLLLGCPSEPTPEPTPAPEPTPVLPGCGNGVIEGIEECDDGEANGDEPDACRADCTAPACGDGVHDSGEACDDGNPYGGDGCSPTCAEESGRLESEPNDTFGQAEDLDSGEAVLASLQPEDTDCFLLDVPADGWVGAATADGDGCPGDVVLRLYTGNGLLRANATPDADGCTTLDPAFEAGARFLQDDFYVLCAEGLLGHVVPTYELTVEIGTDSCALDVPVAPQEDLDGDGESDYCDLDDDGDGIDDLDDNCPEDANGPDTPPLTLHEDGYIQHWLLTGEITGTETTDACRPSLTNSLGDDATHVAELGAVVEGNPWVVYVAPNRRVNFLHLYGGPTPRESYGMVWVRSDVEQAVTLSVGADDGLFAWLNGELLLDVSSCQGVNADQFQAETTLLAGWNRLTMKVRDQGGGWGMMARFLDGDGAPITDLEVSMAADQSWVSNQGDADGDGIGDVCDDSPSD
jgi:cysteine-rich repeat protein